jgi:hypothetical protein
VDQRGAIELELGVRRQLEVQVALFRIGRQHAPAQGVLAQPRRMLGLQVGGQGLDVDRRQGSSVLQVEARIHALGIEQGLRLLLSLPAQSHAERDRQHAALRGQVQAEGALVVYVEARLGVDDALQHLGGETAFDQARALGQGGWVDATSRQDDECQAKM